MKKSNKILAVLLALVMMLTAVPMMTAGAEEVTPEAPETPHVHEYVLQEGATEATCTTDGVRTFVCSCGDVKEEVIPGGHFPVPWGGAEFPNAEKVDGDYHKYLCGECVEFYTEEHTWLTLEELEEFEDYEEWIEDYYKVTKEATCEKEGKVVIACFDDCGAEKEIVLPKIAHNPGEDVEAEGGNHIFKCTECEETITEAHTWDYGEVLDEAKCMKDGELLKTCTVCTETKKEVIPATHDMPEVPNEYTAEGHVYKCEKDCGYSETVEHDLDVLVYTEPTCTEKGELNVYCVECFAEDGGYDEYYDIAALGHTLGEPKKFNDDQHKLVCSVCEEEVKEDHVWDDGKVTVEATCIAKGTKEFTCICGKTKTEEIEKVDHTWGEWTVTTEPTLTDKGVKERSCTVEGCEEKQTEEIDKLKFLVGDINGDGKVQAGDARLVLQHVAGVKVLSAAELARADVDGNGKVQAMDARRILRIVVDLD